MKCLALEFNEEIELGKFLRATQPHNITLQNLLNRIETDLGQLLPERR